MQSSCIRVPMQLFAPSNRAQGRCIYDGTIQFPLNTTAQMAVKSTVLQYPKNRNPLTSKQIYALKVRKLWTNRTKTYGTQSDSYTNPNTASLERINVTSETDVVSYNDIYNSQLPTYDLHLSNEIIPIEPKINPITFPNQDQRQINGGIMNPGENYQKTTSQDMTYIFPIRNPSLFPCNQPQAIQAIPPYQYLQPPVNQKTIPFTNLPTPVGSFVMPPTQQNPPSFQVTSPDGGILLCNHVVNPVTLVPEFQTVSYQPCHPVSDSDVPIERQLPRENVLCDYTFLPTFYNITASGIE